MKNHRILRIVDLSISQYIKGKIQPPDARNPKAPLPRKTTDTSQAKVAGTFVRFLIDQYGTKRFGDLWRGAKGKKETDLSVFEPVYGKPLDQLGKEFYEHLGLSGDSCKSM